MPFVRVFIILVASIALGLASIEISQFFVNERCSGSKSKWHGGNPVKEFLLLKGRQNSHQAKAVMFYIIAELTHVILYFVVIMANGWNIMSLFYCLMTSAFLVISIVDERTFEIPLPCNLFLGSVGVLVCIWDYKNLSSHIIGFFSISVALYLLFLISKGAAIGGGDVKLMAVSGLILGWKLVVLAFFLGCIIASICHVTRMKISKAEKVLAMGPYLCIALWICALWGDHMISLYLGSIGVK